MKLWLNILISMILQYVGKIWGAMKILLIFVRLPSTLKGIIFVFHPVKFACEVHPTLKIKLL